MNRPFRNEPEASTELEEAALWYEGRRPGLGTEFLEAVDATLKRIATPAIGILGLRSNFFVSPTC